MRGQTQTRTPIRQQHEQDSNHLSQYPTQYDQEHKPAEPKNINEYK